MNLIERIQDGRTDLVFDLFRENGDARCRDKNGVSMIKWCAYYGDVSAMKFLLDHGAELDDPGKNLDLNGAVFHGHWRLCQFLLEHGAEANLPDEETGETPLHASLCKASR